MDIEEGTCVLPKKKRNFEYIVNGTLSIGKYLAVVLKNAKKSPPRYPPSIEL